MRCPFSPPLWWQRYVAGGLRSPRQLIAASHFEAPVAAVAADRFFAIPPESLVFDAPERLSVRPSFFTGDGYLTQSHRADWAHCDPRLRFWAAAFIELARKRNIPLYVHSALRSKIEQDGLLARGVTKAAYPLSAHNIGEAVDIVHSVFHWELRPSEWQLLHFMGLRALDLVNARLPKARKLSLNWGGDEGVKDSFRWDPAHWEITDFRSRRRSLPSVERVRMTPRHILANFPI